MFACYTKIITVDIVINDRLKFFQHVQTVGKVNVEY